MVNMKLLQKCLDKMELKYMSVLEPKSSEPYIVSYFQQLFEYFPVGFIYHAKSDGRAWLSDYVGQDFWGHVHLSGMYYH